MELEWRSHPQIPRSFWHFTGTYRMVPQLFCAGFNAQWFLFNYFLRISRQPLSRRSCWAFFCLHFRPAYIKDFTHGKRGNVREFIYNLVLISGHYPIYPLCKLLCMLTQPPLLYAMVVLFLPWSSFEFAVLGSFYNNIKVVFLNLVFSSHFIPLQYIEPIWFHILLSP